MLTGRGRNESDWVMPDDADAGEEDTRAVAVARSNCPSSKGTSKSIGGLEELDLPGMRIGDAGEDG
jgi:hypothetical protein